MPNDDWRLLDGRISAPPPRHLNHQSTDPNPPQHPSRHPLTAPGQFRHIRIHLPAVSFSGGGGVSTSNYLNIRFSAQFSAFTTPLFGLIFLGLWLPLHLVCITRASSTETTKTLDALPPSPFPATPFPATPEPIQIGQFESAATAHPTTKKRSNNMK